MTARATATAWRWPPDSRPQRTLTLCDLDARAIQAFPGLSSHRLAVYHPETTEGTATAAFAAEEDVFRHRQLARQGEVLVHDLDAASRECFGEWKDTSMPSTSKLTGGRLHGAAEYLDKVDFPAPLSPTSPTTSPGRPRGRRLGR